MDRLVTIPREALASLLQATGSPLTPEQYLAGLTASDEFAKYPSRVKASALSKNILLVAAVISVLWTCTPWGFGIEDVIVSVILVAITFFEYRANRGFRERKPEAPTVGYRNQSFFAAFILIYGLYHAFAPMQLPPEYREMMDPDLSQLFHTVTVLSYLAVGIIGGISQFCLAWYYKSARIRTQA